MLLQVSKAGPVSERFKVVICLFLSLQTFVFSLFDFHHFVTQYSPFFGSWIINSSLCSPFMQMSSFNDFRKDEISRHAALALVSGVKLSSTLGKIWSECLEGSLISLERNLYFTIEIKYSNSSRILFCDTTKCSSSRKVIDQRPASYCATPASCINHHQVKNIFKAVRVSTWTRRKGWGRSSKGN